MFTTFKTHALRAGGLMAVLALAACGNLSQVSEKGTTDKPVWPDPASTTFDTGAYPALENLRLIGPGMSKDQIYALLGRPHFGEGLAGVREWDYLFLFRTPNGDVTCQYKVLYDHDKKAQSFLWKPETCADLLRHKQAPAPGKLSLNGDVLFAFGSATLTPAGQAEVNRVAAALPRRGDASIQVTGHTDPIGNDAANQVLSERRAFAVRDQLIAQGIPATSIRALGMGESQPVVQCAAGHARDALQACLAPNRRVDITVTHRSGQ